MKIKPDVLKIWLIIATAVYGVTSLLTLALFLVIPMMFDAPGSENNASLLAFASCIVLYPFISILAVVLGWVLRNKSTQTAFYITLLPLLDAILAFVFALIF